MAGKINIRRVGSVLPTVCLLVFLALCGMVAWLSSAGFPDGVVRYIEEKAAAEGLYLSIGKMRLDPLRGIAVRVGSVRLYVDAEKQQKLGDVRTAAVGLSIAGLVSGELRPSFIQVIDGDIALPVTKSPEEKLHVRVDRLEARGGRNGEVRVTNGKLSLQGIVISLAGNVDPAIIPEGGDQKVNLAAIIEKYRGVIDRVYDGIQSQAWERGEHPMLDVHLDVREEPRIALRLNVPRYDVSQFHFRELVADFLYNKGNITINSLSVHTSDPDASAKLQGAYDLTTRHLVFSMDSTVALVRMIRYVSHPETRAFLEKFRHPDDSPPSVKLGGDVIFEEDYTLASARLRGLVTQKDMMVGKTKVEDLELSFLYDNGDFNVDKLELYFSDGSLRALASAQQNKGQAQIAADLPVQKILTLINELAPKAVELPEGLELGERVNLQLHAQLNAPTFKAGQDTWQDFVPSFHMLGAVMETETIRYGGYVLNNPRVKLKLSEIKQNHNYIPESVQRAELQLYAEESVLPVTKEEQTLHLTAPELEVDLHDVGFAENGLPNELGELKVALKAKEVRQPAPIAEKTKPISDTDEAPHEPKAEDVQQVNDVQDISNQGLTVTNPSIRAAARNVRLDSWSAVETLSAGQAQMQAQADALQLRDVQVRAGEIMIDDVRNFRPFMKTASLFSDGCVKANMADVKLGGHDVGRVMLSAELYEYTKGQVVLQIEQKEGDVRCTVSAKSDWSDAQQIEFKDVQADVPGDVIALLTNLAGVEMEEIEQPELVSIRGDVQLAPSMKLKSAMMHVEVPQLIRTPHRVKVFRERRVPVGLQADVGLKCAQDKEDLLYDVRLEITHETGKLRGHIAGSTEGRLRVTGHNTIRPDIVDELIDNTRVHSIIRDFRFNENTKSTISDIRVQVDYSNGVQVDSFCQVELLNAEYQMCVLLDNADGSESVRTDIGDNPYTLVNRATCGVAAHVQMDCRDPQGATLPDEIVVTVTEPALYYNNQPWLSRNKWDTGTRETKLSGEAVVIDVEHSFVELRRVGGSVYPAYSLGMFYPDLYGYLEDIVLPQPALVQTDMSVFPIYDDCVRPMSGVIRVKSKQGAGFRFIGTTIPLDDFSGFISLADDYVLLDRMNAKSWEGVLDAVVRIGFSGKNTEFDGIVKASCMNMKKIAEAYDAKQSPALCNGEIRFRSPDTELASLTAYGRVDIEDGDLLELSLFRPVGEMISDLPKHLAHMEKEAQKDKGEESGPSFLTRVFSSIFRSLGRLVGHTGGSITNTASNVPGMNHLIAYDLKEAHADFNIANGHLYTRNMEAIGSNLNVQLHADIDLNNLRLRGNLWPKISSLPTILLSPLTVLSDFMMDIVLYGSLTDVKWRIALDRRMKNKSRQNTGKKVTPAAASAR